MVPLGFSDRQDALRNFAREAFLTAADTPGERNVRQENEKLENEGLEDANGRFYWEFGVKQYFGKEEEGEEEGEDDPWVEWFFENYFRVYGLGTLAEKTGHPNFTVTMSICDHLGVRLQPNRDLFYRGFHMCAAGLAEAQNEKIEKARSKGRS